MGAEPRVFRPADLDAALALPLLSAERMGAGGWADPAVLRAVFPGKVRRHEVSGSHVQALDINNARLAGQVRASLRHMRAQAGAHGFAGEAARPTPK
jgi:hypothetical protein